jgi:hypothetical protein
MQKSRDIIIGFLEMTEEGGKNEKWSLIEFGSPKS